MIFLDDGEFAVLSTRDGVSDDAKGSGGERQSIAACPSTGIRSRPRRAATTTSCSRRSSSSRGRDLDTIGARASTRWQATSTISTASTSSPRSQLADRRRGPWWPAAPPGYSCLVGSTLIEQLARHAGRGRPRSASFAIAARSSTSSATIVVPISQSGETADTLAALREAREAGAAPGVIAICNVVAARPHRAREPTTCSTPTPAPRSAWHRPRPSRPRWWRPLPAGAEDRQRAPVAPRPMPEALRTLRGAAAPAALMEEVLKPRLTADAPSGAEVLPRQELPLPGPRASTTRSRSRVRSSSRRSPTSTPRATPPAR